MSGAERPLLGTIEAGGTKFICGAGTGPADFDDRVRIPTTTPAETIREVISYFQSRQLEWGRPLQGIGIGTFGPADLNPASPTFGSITGTPKPGWSNTDLVGPLRREFGIPVGFDTDVNASALGEGKWGAAIGLDSFIYLTIGTGIGGGAVVGDKLVHGLIHPEMGHLTIPRQPDDTYEGHCSFHGGCLEGMASGLAIEERWGKPAEDLPPDHPAWNLEARYLADGLANLVVALSPQRLILGGGVMEQEQLFPSIRSFLKNRLAGYVQHPSLDAEIGSFVVPPTLGPKSGTLGALLMAGEAAGIPI